MVFAGWRSHNMPYPKQARDRGNGRWNQQENTTDRGKYNFSLVPAAYFQNCIGRHTNTCK